MSIVSITTDVAGQIGVKPRRLAIIATDNLATVTTAGYLNSSNLQGFTIESTDEVCMWYGYVSASSPGTFGIFNPVISGTTGQITLNIWENPGNVLLPVVNNDFANFNGTAGQIKDSGYSPSDSTKTKVVMANGAVAVNRLAVFTDVAGTVDDTTAAAIHDGNIQAGLSGTAGTLSSFPATAANGSLILAAINAGGAFNTTISNSAMGQASVVSIPDPGAATANFLLDTGAANILAKQQFVGLSNVLTFGTGTWTVTRIAQGNYVSRHTPANETSIIAIDITPAIRAAASKGFRLDSFDVIYAIAANALDAQSVVLDRIAYADNVAVSVTSVPVTGVLATATQANPYVTNVTVNTPAFDITADSKYVIELTVDNAVASEYDYYGVNLRFSETIG